MQLSWNRKNNERRNCILTGGWWGAIKNCRFISALYIAGSMSSVVIFNTTCSAHFLSWYIENIKSLSGQRATYATVVAVNSVIIQRLFLTPVAIMYYLTDSKSIQRELNKILKIVACFLYFREVQKGHFVSNSTSYHPNKTICYIPFYYLSD
jgi:hypothetical protein